LGGDELLVDGHTRNALKLHVDISRQHVISNPSVNSAFLLTDFRRQTTVLYPPRAKHHDMSKRQAVANPLFLTVMISQALDG